MWMFGWNREEFDEREREREWERIFINRKCV